ncbi:MAG: 16S rRNA (uracil(1498)-N(3))-methyltransferase [Paludibacteraceae bacterium]|nr:16S rRNA (uracil(1498)-N(3))-methyltransferase [Paludibacteraceae bacterium]
MHLFYAPDIAVQPVLPEDESAHAVKVLRLAAGDSVLVLDGKGGVYEATIAVPHPKHCVLNALQPVAPEVSRPYRLHIAIAPTKNMDRLEWFAEKAVEIGIDEITPVFCRFSERKVVKNERLEKILVSAMKQSMQPVLTRLNEPCTFKQLMQRADADQKFIAHCHAGERKLLSHEVRKQSSVLILIGPEGDFSEEEVALALQNGYRPVSLGQTRLRVETAALAACHTVAVINEL